MQTAVVVVLTATCVILTIALLGALRGIAELRLRLVRAGSGADGQLHLSAGRVLPDLLTAALPDEGYTLVAFLSDECETCWQVAAHLRELDVPVVVALEKDTGDLRNRLDGHATFLPAEVAHSSTAELNITFTPVAVVVREGTVAGVAYGESVEDLSNLTQFWTLTTESVPSRSPHPEVSA